MQVFEFPSKSSDAVYRTVISDVGRLDCNCLGWKTAPRRGIARSCTHTKDVIATKGIAVEERDGYLFAVPGRKPSPTVTVPVAVLAAPVAGYVQPMLAESMPDTAVLEDYIGPAYVLEEKFDGHRVTVAVSSEGAVSAWSRPKAGTRVGLSRTLPTHLTATLATFPAGTYDGELIVPGGKSPDVARTTNASKLAYMVFDVVSLLGKSLTSVPYADRRAYLEEIFKSRGSARVRLSVAVPVSRAALDAIRDAGGEGVILKRVASTYRPGGRPLDWIKIKGLASATLTCTGFTDGAVKNSVVNLVDADGRETTVKVRNMAEQRLIDADPASFIGRELVIEYTERTASGAYRHGRFDHWKEAA